MSKFKVGGLCCLSLLLVAAFAFHRVSANRGMTHTIPQDTPDGGITIQLQPVVSGLTTPVFVTNAHDGSNRLFIVEQAGIIKVLQPGSTTPTVFLNITSRVLDGGERGLLGLTFHPQYASNRRFFVYYTREPDGAIQVAEYLTNPTNPNIADTAEKIIITIPHPTNSNHNGGTVEFGSDGYLYLAPGDGGSGNDPPNNAQNLNVLLGKMLRLDIDDTGTAPYLVPPDNPFVGVAGADEIYAFGLRNPYRFSFDRGGTRQLYVGDVGQGAWEEIDIITSGGNYGWRIMEGNHCNPNFNGGSCTPPAGHIPPIAEYSSASPSTRCSITGGYVYRGRRSTLPLGSYVFADYCTGEILLLNPASSSGSQMLLLDTSINIVGFGEDEAGEIYVVGNSAVTRIVNPNAPIPRNVVADFDGDLKTDFSVFRNSSGAWYLRNSFTNTMTTILFGTNGDTVTPGDFDGDGKTDPAIWRAGVFYVLRSSNNSVLAQSWGAPGDDAQVVADYDGDRRTDFAVFRPGSPATWYILNSGNNTARTVNWGIGGDEGVIGDYDGDGQYDITIYRASTSTFHFLRSRDGVPNAVAWGTAATDEVVPGDYDGDQQTDFAVFRNTTGVWHIRQSSNGAPRAEAFGASGDDPVPGDYDGDGKTDLAVTRVASGILNWYVLRSANGTTQHQQWGLSTDYEVPTYQTR